MKHRYGALFALIGLALSMLLVAPSVSADPPGNNGTVKIQDAGGSDLPDNNPHVGCVFKVAFTGFDAGQEAGFTISGQEPSGTGQIYADGGTLDGNGDGVFAVDLTGLLGGLDYQPNQGYHLQLVDTLTQKSKTFWSNCDPAPPTTGSITLYKTDQNGQPLANVCFTMQMPASSTAGRLGFLAGVTPVYCTGENGYTDPITDLAVPGSYTFTETADSVPAGCTAAGDVTVQLTAESANQTATFVNQCAAPVTGSITVKKVDQHGDPIADVCFNLGTKSFMAAQSGANCTGADGTIVISGLAVPGTYTLVEESAPENCTTNDVPQDIALTSDNPNVTVTVTNQCNEKPQTGSITVTKVDQNGKPLAGACFNLGQKGFMAAQSGANCTDENGQLVISDLPVPGTYTLVEEQAPDGCTTSDVPQDIELTPAKPDVTVTVTNACGEQPTGSITIKKVDQHGQPVANACFNLGLKSGFAAAQSGACTDEDGTLVIAGLTVPGTYELVEESAPKGCKITGLPQTIELTEGTPDVTVTVTNECEEKPVTPATPVAPEKPVTPLTPAKTPAAVTALPTTGAGAGTGPVAPAIWLLLAGASVFLIFAGGAVRFVAARRTRR